ncbi:hypothetical protein D3C72_1534230 [compost metagenome]
MAAAKQGKQEDKKETKWDGDDPWVAQFDEWPVQTHNAARIVRNARCGGLRNRSLGFQLLSGIAILSVGDSLRERCDCLHSRLLLQKRIGHIGRYQHQTDREDCAAQHSGYDACCIAAAPVQRADQGGKIGGRSDRVSQTNKLCDVLALGSDTSPHGDDRHQ